MSYISGNTLVRIMPRFLIAVVQSESICMLAHVVLSLG